MPKQNGPSFFLIRVVSTSKVQRFSTNNHPSDACYSLNVATIDTSLSYPSNNFLPHHQLLPSPTCNKQTLPIALKKQLPTALAHPKGERMFQVTTLFDPLLVNETNPFITPTKRRRKRSTNPHLQWSQMSAMPFPLTGPLN